MTNIVLKEHSLFSTKCSNLSLCYYACDFKLIIYFMFWSSFSTVKGEPMTCLTELSEPQDSTQLRSRTVNHSGEEL